MLLDPYGRELVRRKQYGLTRGPIEFVFADPPAAADLVDAIGDTTIPLDDDDEGQEINDSPTID